MSDLILLTGAGFTKNFGGYLGNEMWAKIFNNPVIHDCPDLKFYLLKRFNYEDAYFEFIQEHPEKYDDKEKEGLIIAMIEAYKKLDESVKSTEWRQLIDSTELFGRFLRPFHYHFTLNQDLFFERHFKVLASGSPKLPIHDGDFFTNIEEKDFVKLGEVQLSEVSQAIKSHNGPAYLKLHGSYGWLSSDGKRKLVIGRNKIDDINNEPLLRCYFNIFKEKLNEGNKKLLIIGYGFVDEHINIEIHSAVENSGLKVYIINPSMPDRFSSIIRSKPKGDDIWSSVMGYFPYRLSEIFPRARSKTVSRSEIESALGI